MQRKIEKPGEEEREKMEHNGMTEEEISKKTRITERVITMEWLNANPGVKIISEDSAHGYRTYGLMQEKAFAYKRITYKEIYPGVDLVYSLNQKRAEGFEYSLVIKSGADLNGIKMVWQESAATTKPELNQSESERFCGCQRVRKSSAQTARLTYSGNSAHWSGSQSAGWWPA